MKRIISTSLALTLALMACDKKDATHAHDENGQHTSHAETPTTPEVSEAKTTPGEKAEEKTPSKETELAKVSVEAKGSAFDPPVQATRLPEGAWYCDMGTVHWAAMEKPADGKCPTCSMPLKQFSASKLEAQKQNAVEAHEHDDHGHDHGEHGHEH